MTIERKTFAPVELKLSDAGSVTVAFAQTGVVDHDSDLTMAGAFPAKNVPMSAYGHTSWLGELPTGKGAIHEEGDWAIFDGQFLMDTEQGLNAYKTVKAMGDLQEWSYGYDPVDYAYEQRDGKQIRVLKSLDVFEVSPVLMGAGIGTHTRAIKSGGLGSGLPFVDHLSLVADEAKTIAARAKSRVEFRAKEGRDLSAANRERLKALAESLTEIADGLQELGEDPEKEANTAHQIEAVLEEARYLGVAV